MDIPRDEDLTELVKRRTREVYKLKAGKISETSSAKEMNSNDHIRSTQALDTNTPGSTGNEPTMQALWEKIEKMADTTKKQIGTHTEIIANLAANVLTIQKSLDKGQDAPNKTADENERQNTLPMPSVDGLEDISDEEEEDDDAEDDQLDIDAVMSSDDEADVSTSDNILDDLEKIYETPNKFGKNMEERLAKVVNQAIDKPLTPTQFKDLQDKYLIPENCKRIQVPQINQEIWKGYKTDRQKTPDLAIQAVQRCLTTSLVIVLQTLEKLKDKADVNEVKQNVKDMFTIMTHGIYVANRKRKQLVAPRIPTKYRKVADVNIAVTDFLFGDNLEQKLEEVEKEDKRASKLSYENDFLEKRKGEKRSGPHYHHKMPPKKKEKWNNSKQPVHKKGKKKQVNHQNKDKF